MTNKEKYRQAFSAIHASAEFTKELKEMEQVKKYPKRIRFSAVAACLTACILVLSCATVAYAADFGGFRQTVQLLIRGGKAKATVQLDGQGNYAIDYVDEDGKKVHQDVRSYQMMPDGSKVPSSNEAILRHLQAPDVVLKEDGTVMLYWRKQALDITDRFQDGVAYVLLEDVDETLYLTISRDGGWKCGFTSFPSPD